MVRAPGVSPLQPAIRTRTSAKNRPLGSTRAMPMGGAKPRHPGSCWGYNVSRCIAPFWRCTEQSSRTGPGRLLPLTRLSTGPPWLCSQCTSTATASPGWSSRSGARLPFVNSPRDLPSRVRATHPPTRSPHFARRKRLAESFQFRDHAFELLPEAIIQKGCADGVCLEAEGREGRVARMKGVLALGTAGLHQQRWPHEYFRCYTP